MTTHENVRAPARLLDPRFRYTPAAATDIAATWKRFGFDPQVNEQRRRGKWAPAALSIALPPHALVLVKS